MTTAKMSSKKMDLVSGKEPKELTEQPFDGEGKETTLGVLLGICVNSSSDSLIG
jgi:hypothetical protein